jgi:dUTP pyrophosphatase
MEHMMANKRTELKIFKAHPQGALPAFATEQSACFDLTLQIGWNKIYTGYNNYGKKFERPFSNEQMLISPGDRVMVPTGLIFDIPEGYSVRIHPRSGLSLKQGLVLANMEGVIDADFTDEVFVLLMNTTDNGWFIKNGDRIAQAELVRKIKYHFVEIDQPPKKKTSREGGFGSTGP